MTRTATNLFNGLCLAVALVCMPAPSLGAASVRTKTTRLSVKNGQLTATVGFREMLGGKLKKRLRSGFATTVVMRLSLYRAGGKRPVAVAARTVQAVYDLWGNDYLLTTEDSRGVRTDRLRSQRQVVDRLTSCWQFPLVANSKLDHKRQYFIAGLIEVNPLSREVLTEVRRWLRQPYRRQRTGTRESFFGSFVSVFVNDKVHRADKIFKFRSQLFVVP